MLLASAAAPALIGPVANPTPSWWLQNIPTRESSAAAPPETADIAIIGAGMTGCAVAYWLHTLVDAPQQVVVLDARGVAGGVTGRNGGHLWCNPSSDFERESTAELLKFLEEREVDCDLQRHGAAALERKEAETGVEYSDTAADPEAAAVDEEWAEPTTWDAAEIETKLQTEAFVHASVYPEAMSFYPAKVANALLDAASATLVAPIRVLGIDAESGGDWQHLRWQCDGSGASSSSPLSGVLRARKVVVATNGWAAELLPELQNHLYPTRNQVIMTKPLPKTASWQVGGWSVDSDVGARELYAIRRPDGRVCFGGARALEPNAAVGNADDGSTSDVVGAYLRRFLSERFPQAVGPDGAVEVEAEWTGTLGFTSDGKPLVGTLPGRPNVYVAAGFNGHGMPQCFGVGKAVALLLSGREEEMNAYVREVVRADRVVG